MAPKLLRDSERVELIFKWGSRLRQARESTGISQAQLAALSSTNQPQIARIEGGGPVSVPVQVRIARSLQTPVTVLFPRDASEAKQAKEAAQ